jgi:hypothetical protein
MLISQVIITTIPNSRALLSYFAVLVIYKLSTEGLTIYRPKVILKSLTGPLGPVWRVNWVLNRHQKIESNKILNRILKQIYKLFGLIFYLILYLYRVQYNSLIRESII